MIETQTVDTVAEFGDDEKAIQRRWVIELKLAEKARRNWTTRVKKIIKRYRDENLNAEASDEDIIQANGEARFNVLWSNEQTLGPAIYAASPKPVVERRFRDKDPVARAASVILERALSYLIETGNLHRIMKRCRKDYLLTSQAIAWVRYEAEFDEAPEPTETDEFQENSLEFQENEIPGIPKLRSENCFVDYVHWSDYRCSVSRTEEEVWWRARQLFMTREKLVKRFGERGKTCPLNWAPKDTSKNQAAIPELQGHAEDAFNKASVWEIWDKEAGKVYFICEAAETPLQVADDPLHLKGFWPMPDPLKGTETNDTVVPVPEYVLYQDQARELDTLTQRISSLTKALKVAGVYNASQPELVRLLEEGVENQLIPVDNWAAFADQGGMKGAVDFLPVDLVATVLLQLYQARSQVKSDLYEVTGISDILRGAQTQGADPTATEQRIKGQFANIRLSDRQDAIATFACDILRIQGELIAEHFAPETLREMSGWDQYCAENILPLLQAAQEQQSQQVGMPAAGQGGLPGASPALGFTPPGPAGIGTQSQDGTQQPQNGTQIPGIPENTAIPEAPGLPMVVPQQQPMQAAFDPQQVIDGLFEQAVALLRNDKLRSFRIDIETNSTIEPDQAQEKKDRMEFIQAATAFLQQAGQIGMTAPKIIPLLGKLLLFGVRAFPVSRSLEAAFEQAIGEMEIEAKQPQEQPPSPEQIKAQAMQQQAQIEMAMRQQEMQFAQQEMAAKQAHAKMEFEAKQAEISRKFQADQAAAEIDERLKNIELERREREHALIMAELERKDQLSKLDHARNIERMDHDVMSQARDLQLKSLDREEQASFTAEQRTREQEHAKVKHENDMSAMEEKQRLAGGKPRMKTKPEKIEEDKVAKLVETIHTLIADQSKKHSDLVKIMSSPRKIVRGPDGKAVGVQVSA